MNKKFLKKNSEELAAYLQFKRRGSQVPALKGRGAQYKRKPKHLKREEEY